MLYISASVRKYMSKWWVCIYTVTSARPCVRSNKIYGYGHDSFMAQSWRAKSTRFWTAMFCKSWSHQSSPENANKCNRFSNRCKTAPKQQWSSDILYSGYQVLFFLYAVFFFFFSFSSKMPLVRMVKSIEFLMYRTHNFCSSLWKLWIIQKAIIDLFIHY